MASAASVPGWNLAVMIPMSASQATRQAFSSLLLGASRAAAPLTCFRDPLLVPPGVSPRVSSGQYPARFSGRYLWGYPGSGDGDGDDDDDDDAGDGDSVEGP